VVSVVVLCSVVVTVFVVFVYGLWVGGVVVSVSCGVVVEELSGGGGLLEELCGGMVGCVESGGWYGLFVVVTGVVVVEDGGGVGKQSSMAVM